MNGNIRTRVLIITGESALVPGETAADAGLQPAEQGAEPAPSPVGVRPYHNAWTLAEALSATHDVILAVPEKTGHSHRNFAVVYYTRRNIGLLAAASEVVICDRKVLDRNPFLAETSCPIPASLKNLAASDIDSVLEGGDAENHREPGKDEAGMFIWRSPSTVPDKGLRYYLARLRYHIRTDGVRGAVSRGGSLIKRKSASKEKSD